MCRIAGLALDPWQELVVAGSLGEDEDGQWSAFEVAVVAPRQNGKNEILIARELVGLFLLGERLIIHSAHMFDTSLEAFRRLLAVIEDTSEFSRRVRRVSRAHGEEGIELAGGQRIRFRTRTKGGGRGFTSDCLILDEAMELPEAMHGALLPTLSARPNPQVWYTGSAVDQEVHDNGVVFSRVRERGVSGDDPSLAFFEWGMACEHPDRLADEVARSPRSWAQANPGLGIRISADHIEHERASMASRTFAVERLGVGDWPRTDGLTASKISREAWGLCADTSSRLIDPVCFAVDVTPDRSRTSIYAAGRRPDGRGHVEVVERMRGTAGVVARLAQLVGAHHPLGVVLDASGPAGSLLPELADAGVDVTPVSAKEHSQACGMLFDAVDDRTICHLGDPDLDAAVAGAIDRPLGEAWGWSRKNSAVDISPLVASTLAYWGLVTQKRPAKSRVINLNDV